MEQMVEPEVRRIVKTESGETFHIQKNITIVGTYRGVGASLRYPFNEMVAGDSFEIQCNPEEVRLKVSRLSSACVSYCKTRNQSAKFTVRRTSPITVRVWRVK